MSVILFYLVVELSLVIGGEVANVAKSDVGADSAHEEALPTEVFFSALDAAAECSSTSAGDCAYDDSALSVNMLQRRSAKIAASQESAPGTNILEINSSNVDNRSLHSEPLPESGKVLNTTGESVFLAEFMLNESSDGAVLPPCKQRLQLAQLPYDFSWCDPQLVPPEWRVPPKLQGLFWMNGLPLPDVVACLSRAFWDAEKLTLTTNVWSDFVYRDTEAAKAFLAQIWSANMHYTFTFTNADLNEAQISPHGAGLSGTMSMHAFDVVSSFPLIADPQSATPGDKWQRPSYFGLWHFKVKTNEYQLWRVLDGSMRVVEDNYRAMLGKLGDISVLRYSNDCLPEGYCTQDTGGSCTFLSCADSRGRTKCIQTPHGLSRRCMCQFTYCAQRGQCVPRGLGLA